MKATLLIKNIENLYTCDKNFTILHHAFIACHHDKIIEINTGSYKEWLDPATRVIDAQGECVVPAFIDCQFKSFRMFFIKRISRSFRFYIVYMN